MVTGKLHSLHFNGVCTASCFYFRCVLLSSKSVISDRDVACRIHPRTSYNYESRCSVSSLLSVVVNYSAHPSYYWPLLADGLSSLQALLEALDNLDAVCDSVEKKYHASLQEGRFEKWEEKS